MGTDKARLAVEGQTMVERGATTLESFAQPVIIASGTVGRLGPLRWAEVGDDPLLAGAGPLAGIAAALSYLTNVASATTVEAAALAPRSGPRLVAVLAVDHPSPSARLFEWLAAQWTGEAAVIPIDTTGRAQPLHGVFSLRIGPGIADAVRRGARRVADVLDALGALRVDVPDDLGSAWAVNWNDPGDLPDGGVLG